MITAGQIRAARALLGMDQRQLAEQAGLSLPTVQRMEAAEGVVGGNIESLTKMMSALTENGIELLDERSQSQGAGRGVRFKIRPGASCF